MSFHPGVELPEDLAKALPPHGFRETTVLVVGDLMLDRYLSGDVDRISPEAPVPVVSVKQERATAGGAGNVALNVNGLKARAIVAGMVGEDPAGRCLVELLSSRGVDTAGIVRVAGRRTTCKTRVLCGSHQIVRLDEETTVELEPSLAAELLERVVSVLDRGVSAVILSDYAKGVLGEWFTRAAIAACVDRNVAVFVDPKRVDFGPYSRATCITPNFREFQTASRMSGHVDVEIEEPARRLLEKLDCAMLLVTQGAQGMTLVTREETHHFPALVEEVFDVSGAGDTVIATVATAFAGGVGISRAVELSNFAASVVVRRVGTVPVEWTDLSGPLSASTID